MAALAAFVRDLIIHECEVGTFGRLVAIPAGDLAVRTIERVLGHTVVIKKDRLPPGGRVAALTVDLWQGVRHRKLPTMDVAMTRFTVTANWRERQSRDIHGTGVASMA